MHFEPGEIAVQAEEILKQADPKSHAIIPLLRLAVEKWGAVNQEIEEWVATKTGVSVVRVREVSSFYAFLRQRYLKEKRIKVCTGLSCALRHSSRILDALRHQAELHGVSRRPEEAIVVEEAECMGCCDQSPVLSIGEEWVGKLDEHMILEILRQASTQDSPRSFRR